MFQSINKNQYTLSEQNSAKRHNFRVEIRRKAVESYQKRIRTQWSQSNTQTNSQQIAQTYQLIQNRTQTSNSMTKNQRPLHPFIATHEALQTLQILQQLSLTQGSQLCTPQTLQTLTNILNSTTNYAQISDHISKILIKICISEIYWDEDFLALLFCLILKVHHFGADCSQFLLNLSECAQLNMKVVIYGIVIGSGILEEQVKSNCEANEKGKGKFCKLRTLRILSNFLLVAPIVSHSHPHLSKSQTPNQTPIQKLLQILSTLVLQPHQPLTFLPRLQNKEHYNILELLYGMFSRLESRQLPFILPILRKQKWKIFDVIVVGRFGCDYLVRKYDCEDDEEEGFFYGGDGKIKGKFMQCVLVVVRFCVSEQQFRETGLQFFYLFLPTIIHIIVQDIPPTSPINPPITPITSFTETQSQKYTYLLLQILYTLLNIHDRENQLPALEYISATHPQFFFRIFSSFSRNADLKKLKLLAWIFQILNNQVNGICQLQWANQFIQYVIIDNGHLQGFQSVLVSVLETVEMILVDDQSCGVACRVFRTITNAATVAKLESLLNSDKPINPNITNAIQNILSIIGKREPD